MQERPTGGSSFSYLKAANADEAPPIHVIVTLKLEGELARRFEEERSRLDLGKTAMGMFCVEKYLGLAGMRLTK